MIASKFLKKSVIRTGHSSIIEAFVCMYEILCLIPNTAKKKNFIICAMPKRNQNEKEWRMA